MKKILAVHSKQTPEIEKERKILEEIFHRFIIEHYIVENKENIPKDIDGIIFGNGTDCIQIVKLMNKLSKKVPMVRIYSAPKGYEEIPELEVYQDVLKASVYLKDFLN